MIIEVNGKQVEVDDSFAKLSPEKQQAELQYIIQAMGPKESVGERSVNQEDLVNRLYATIGGGIAGEIAGPVINKGVEAARTVPTAPSPVPGSINPAAPGQKWAAKTGFGVGPGQTVEEVSTAFKEQSKPIGSGKISSKIPRNVPMNVDKMLELDAAKQAEAARRAAALQQAAPPASKLPVPLQKAGKFIQGATQSAVAPWLGRGVAGAGAGFQAADAYNRFRQGDIPGAAISGVGALGSAASFIPTPVTRMGGAAIGIGAEGLNQYIDYLKQKAQQQPAQQQPQQEQMPVPMKEGGLAYFAKGGSTTPAWQRKEGKNPEGGLNAAGRASYNRETGGNLKAPQPEGGSRKKSFCARMGGMKKKLTSSKTANDPDSRINKALRKWDC